MIQRRAYQQAAIDCVTAWLASREDSCTVVLPTGSGKTIVMAGLCQDYLTTWPDTRILVLAHVRELIEQNAQKLAALWPEAPLGVYSAGLKQRDTQSAVIFAGIQSVHTRASELGHFDLIFIDEAHRIPASGLGMYRTFIAAMTAINPHLRVVGFTATPYRLGVGKIYGPDKILNGVCYEIGVGELIKQGYLSRLVSRGSKARADFSGVAIKKGEYVEAEQEAVLMEGDLVERTALEITQLAADRNAWLIFSPTLAHAEAISAALGALGVNAPVIHAGTPPDERERLITDYRAHRLRALVNINVLSEGFDAPHVDCVVMLRRTKSAGLYYQQVGRALRLAPGKTDALVLDFVGNVGEHGPIDAIRPPKAKGATLGDAPMKLCPECLLYVLAGVKVCACGFAFPERDPHADKASSVSILRQPPEWADVTSVRYAMHQKGDKTPTLRVTYQCGLTQANEWICVQHEHGSYAQLKAARWWDARMPDSRRAMPTTVSEALDDVELLVEPVRILIDTNGKYPEIVSYEFAEANQLEIAI